MVTVKAKWMPSPVTGEIIFNAFGILVVDTGVGWYSMKKEDIEIS